VVAETKMAFSSSQGTPLETVGFLPLTSTEPKHMKKKWRVKE